MPSPESKTVPEVLPVEKRERTAELPMYNFGTLNSPNLKPIIKFKLT